MEEAKRQLLELLSVTFLVDDETDVYGGEQSDRD